MRRTRESVEAAELHHTQFPCLHNNKVVFFTVRLQYIGPEGGGVSLTDRLMWVCELHTSSWQVRREVQRRSNKLTDFHFCEKRSTLPDIQFVFRVHPVFSLCGKFCSCVSHGVHSNTDTERKRVWFRLGGLKGGTGEARGMAQPCCHPLRSPSQPEEKV